MSQKVKGNTRGLAPAQLRRVQKLYERRIDKDAIVPLEYARELYSIAHDLRRRVGVLVSREGRVLEVFLGTNEILYLPELGRYRLGKGRLRRLRLLFSDLSKSEKPVIPNDIYTDLERLRLDMVVSIKVGSNKTSIAYAHLIPRRHEEDPSVRTEVVPDIGPFEYHFTDALGELEDQLEQRGNLQPPPGTTPALLVGVYDRSVRDVDA